MEQKNIYIIEKKITSIINKLNEIINTDNKNIDILEKVLKLAIKHSENIILMKTAIKVDAEQNYKESIDENTFKDHILAANEFANDSDKLLSKYF